MIASFDPRSEYLDHKAEIDAAIDRALSSGQLILGPEVRAFEQEFAAYLGVPGAVGVGSGTDALTLALRGLGIGSGDEVITVANAGVPPVAAIRATGAVPRFVDVLSESLLMDPDQLADALTPRTRCILPVHLYGQLAPMEPILDFAARRGLQVVEDCAQAHGARLLRRHAGGFGSAGCFSFYPTKNLGALGDGGLVATADPALEARVRSQRMYGFDGDRHARCEGLNSRLDELQAAVLRVKLGYLDEAIAARRRIADRYMEGLKGSALRLPAAPSPEAHAYHLFVVRSPDRARVLAALEGAGIGFGIHYATPVHLMEAYEFLGYREGDLPVSERASGEVVSLPIYPGLELDAVDRVVEALRGAA